MFTKSGGEGARAKGGATLSFIGAEAVVNGDIRTSAQLHIDGSVVGDVDCAMLIQGKGGKVAGNIVAEEAQIAGLVEGTVTAGILVLEASARVTGDVFYETVSIAAGAEIEGRFTRRNTDLPGEAAAGKARRRVAELFPTTPAAAAAAAAE